MRNHDYLFYNQKRFVGQSVKLWAPGKDEFVEYTLSFHVSVFCRALYDSNQILS